MSKTARVPEPSMEEILASIRRIIADDSGVPRQAPPRPVPVSAPAAGMAPNADLDQPDVDAVVASDETSSESDVLELTQPVEPSATPSFTAVRGPDVVFREEERRAPAQPRPAPMPAPAAVRRTADDRLLSPNSTAAVSAAFNSLASTVLSENARTLEDIVKEMMRPMLKDWLDENLPSLVERIVRAEIERVARGGR
jgi:cell pole-organizing protein PopZ